MTLSPTGLLIIRAWVEHGSSRPLRAHFRLTSDIAGGATSEVTVTDIEAATSVLETWLRQFIEAN